ncbi:MAG: fimbria/pilus outer membrane usher protein [Nitrospirota bacterium]|nr:fimbria/pilus outer membrane usher protein [Nitrospirota bacterium]
MFRQSRALLSLTLLSASLIASLSPAAAAEKQSVLTVILNAEHKGDFFFLLTAEQDVLMKRRDFLQLGLSEETAGITTVSGELYISLKSVSGLAFSVDKKRASLTLLAEPSLFKEQTLDISYRKPYAVTYSRDNSAFLNYGVRYTTREPSFNLSSELGFRTADYLATSSFNYIRNDATDKNVRLLTSVRTDDRALLRTYVAGDAPAVSGILGTSAVIGGITVAKNYAIDPYFIRFPSLSFSGAVVTPSEVDIRVNGMSVRKEGLQPGEFHFDNIPGIVGLGTADIVIKDAFGRESVLSRDFYYSDHLLEKGLHEYSYSVGFIRRDLGTKSFSYGKAAALVFHNYGFSAGMKGGFFLEASDDRLTMGPAGSFLIPGMGVVDAGLALSTSEGETGWGGYLNYSFSSRVFNADIFARSLSEKYSNLTLDSSDDKPSVDVSAVVGVTGKTYGSLSLASSISRMRNEADIKHYAVSYTKILARNCTFFATASRTDDNTGINDQLFFGLNIYFGKGISGSVNYQLQNEENISGLSFRKSLPPGPGFGFSMDVSSGDTATDLAGLMEYQNDYGIYGFGHRRRDGYDDTLFSAAGGIGYIDGSVFFSRPILDSFAKVNIEGLEGVRVYHFGNEIGKTDKAGNVIIPAFHSFIDNKLDIESRDIPVNYRTPALVRYVAPPFRSGSLVKFDITKLQAVSGSLFVIEDGIRTPVEFGEITVLVKGKRFSGLVGRRGEFYIENVPEGRHRAEITYKSRQCFFELAVPDSREIWIDVGESYLRCEN